MTSKYSALAMVDFNIWVINSSLATKITIKEYTTESHGYYICMTSLINKDVKPLVLRLHILYSFFLRPKEFSIKNDTVNTGWSIVYIYRGYGL